MGFDIRLPIGALFTLVGLMLATYGALSDRAMYARSLGININLLWGLVLLAFGASMLALWRRAYLARMRAKNPPM